MRLSEHHHLSYCTNIHRGEDWAETFAALKTHTLRVKEAVCPNDSYGIGLRLSDAASRELVEPATLDAFRRWLDETDCYVYALNGFPYGKFHGGKVKDQAYSPDWTTPERLAYTKRLFDLVSVLAPAEVGGSVSTVPGSFKGFNLPPDAERAMFANFHACMQHIETLREANGKDLHLGVEPEPLCTFETSEETVDFLNGLLAAYPADEEALRRAIGVNYDTCHLAVEFEEAGKAIGRIRDAGFRLSKIHLSSALKLKPTEQSLARLRVFGDDIYLHQVVIRGADGNLARYVDLPETLERAAKDRSMWGEEWRVHYHVPLHAEPEDGLESTADHLRDTLDLLAKDPWMCAHLEMETYTWEVLPESLRQGDVVDQLAREYAWTLEHLKARGLLGEG